MRVLSYIQDSRISASNVSIELSTRDYLKVAVAIVDQNEFQRRKVISSRLKTTLKRDLQRNCTIPAIVLGVKQQSVPDSFDYKTFNNDSQVAKWINEKSLIVLDGLQRTHVMMELLEEDPDGVWLDQKVRCEIYIGIQKLGVLYRMLTLNTGQTTMSTRHLLEILYHDYLNVPLPDGLKLVRDKDAEPADARKNEYSFRDVLDGYSSFISNHEIPVERAEILQNVETIERLERSDYEKDGFQAFVEFLHALMQVFSKSITYSYDENRIKGTEYAIKSSAFGKDVYNVFAKSQSITGLGAALSFIKAKRGLDFVAAKDLLSQVDFKSSETGMDRLILAIDYIKTRSNKVGNDQRYLFKEFYLGLLDKEKEESYLNFEASAQKAALRIRDRIEPDSQ